MAEEQAVQEEGINIPDSQKAHDEWAPTAEEQRALSGGWKPSSDDMPNPDDWVDARTFNVKGELMQRITQQGRTIGNIESQLAEARNMIAASDRVTQRLIKDAVDQTRRDLRRQRREALDEDDHTRAEQIDDELDELKTAQAEIKEVQAEPVQDVGQRQPTPIEAAWFTFVTSTPWAQDDVLNPQLLAHANGLRNSNPDMSVGDFMESVLDKGKELRGLKTVARPSTGPDDSKGSNRKSSRDRNKNAFSAKDLSDQQRFIAQGFVDDGASESLDAYAKELGESGALEHQGSR